MIKFSKISDLWYNAISRSTAASFAKQLVHRRCPWTLQWSRDRQSAIESSACKLLTFLRDKTGRRKVNKKLDIERCVDPRIYYPRSRADYKIVSRVMQSRRAWWSNTVQFEIRAFRWTMLTGPSLQGWFDVSDVFRARSWRRTKNCRRRVLCARFPCLSFAARSRRKLRPISGDAWFTAAVSIGARSGLRPATPSLFPSPRRCFLFFKFILPAYPRYVSITNWLL